MKFIDTLINYFNSYDASEVFINGIYRFSLLLNTGILINLDPIFDDTDHLLAEIQEFAFDQEVRLDPHFPANGGTYQSLVNGKTEETFRWHCIMQPIADDGPFFSLRKHQFFHQNISFLCKADWQPIVDKAVKMGLPIIICGSTGVGKSTLLAQILQKCRDKRIIIIENVKELPLLSKNWLRLVTTPPLLDGRTGFDSRKLLFESLRMRPDSIVLGELRGMEAITFYQAYLSGHSGIFTTIHAESPETLVKRLDDLTSNKLQLDSWKNLFGIKSPLVISLRNIKGFEIKDIQIYKDGLFREVNYADDLTGFFCQESKMAEFG